MKRRILSILFVAGLVLMMWPCTAGTIAANSSPNYGFVPNSGEASVSRVDLVNMTEVARYYTAPRLGDEVDLEGNPDPGNPNAVPPVEWRTSRIALDSGGNAWVLNTGADGTDLQGSVVRVQADTTGLTDTHAYPDPLLPFGTDEAVQVFLVGAPGDMPRAIAIDSEGYIWVGFYSGAQLMKYEYNVVAGTLEPVAGPFFPDVSPDNVIRYYDMQFAPDGTLFISSRDSTPTHTPREEGIWTFNPDTVVFTHETSFNPYAVLIAEDGTVYATSYDDQLHIRDEETDDWSSAEITGSSQNRGMEFDDQGRIWIASTVGTTEGDIVYSYDIDSGTSGPTYTLTSGTTPVGMGRDAAGNIWTICRSDAMDEGWIEGFDPVTQDPVGAIEVGFRPYAYRDFVCPLTIYRICGYKYLAGTTEGLEGWTIILEKKDPTSGEFEQHGDPVLTDEHGRYCFQDLEPGEYRITETLEWGWRQVEPPDPGYHQIELPAYDSHPEDGLFYNFENERITIPPVGGTGHLVNRLVLLAPWLALAAMIAGAAVFARRRLTQG